MLVQTIELEGDALHGVGYQLCKDAIDSLPKTVRLGRIRPRAMPSALKLGAYLPTECAAGAIPGHGLDRVPRGAIPLR